MRREPLETEMATELAADRPAPAPAVWGAAVKEGGEERAKGPRDTGLRRKVARGAAG